MDATRPEDEPTPTAPNAHRFLPLAPERAAQWANFARWPDRVYFPSHLGIEVEELRADYARLRLPWKPELAQPAGVMHGGAIATLIDTTVVPAIGTAYETAPAMVTISMNVSFLGAIANDDAVAEGWVEQRGRSMVFCRVEVRSGRGSIAAAGSLVYKVQAG